MKRTDKMANIQLTEKRNKKSMFFEKVNKRDVPLERLTKERQAEAVDSRKRAGCAPQRGRGEPRVQDGGAGSGPGTLSCAYLAAGPRRVLAAPRGTEKSELR